MKKINLGGGSKWSEEGWHNLEISTGYDLEKELLKDIPDKSIEIIYTSHCLEHLSWPSVDAILKSCYRVLKPGGLMRIVLPDVDIMWKIVTTKDRSILEKNNPGYYKTGGGANLSINQCVNELFGYNQDGDQFLHNTMHRSFFNKSIVGIMLTSAGFEKIEEKSFCV